MVGSGHSVQDTIVAVGSPPGASWRGLVRISGARSGDVLRALLHVCPPAEPWASGAMFSGRLLRPDVPCLYVRFGGPRSYTGEDVVELQLPGNAALLDRVLHRAVSAGARLAEPGEFTFRAFLNGKMDLTQAEGVAATIAATSDGQLRAAGLLRDGELGAFSQRLVDSLATQLALVEAGIDFTDQEDVVPIGPGELDRQLSLIESELSRLLERSRSWGALEALPRVVLVGPPSAGKSSLFNALLGRQRAVIDELPGTTRDVLEEPLELACADGRRIEVMLVDIAGLDRAEAAFDRQVQTAARAAVERADLVVRVSDGMSENLHDDLNVPCITALSKADLELPRRGVAATGFDVTVSAVTGEGLDQLRSAIASAVGDRGVSVRGEMLALQPRHESSLRAALEAIADARAQLEPQRDGHQIAGVELVAGQLRAALDELAALGGQMTPDDVIGRVFATFCVGK